ncbi:MAG: cache domain-containing protein, partial [Deltaproteobacteria bacterium]|nr:cache domain-containing protein [Deltaproteobacteria bacterium]
MRKTYSRTRKRVVIAVAVTSLAFLAAGGILGFWSARELKDVVADQFNEEQLTMARNVARLIERELRFLEREILMLQKDEALKALESTEKCNTIIQKTLSRVIESGVWKIEILDLGSRRAHVFTPYRHWLSKEAMDTGSLDLPRLKDFKGETVWVSKPRIRPSAITLIMVSPLPGESPRLLLFNINISWFLCPFLKDIRSGKTGYAWLIDEKGRFLFHPRVDFLGRDAF